ncbi:MAG: PAS domain S-box protein [Cyanobacteria bacterium P01_F01_bin.56]
MTQAAPTVLLLLSSPTAQTRYAGWLRSDIDEPRKVIEHRHQAFLGAQETFLTASAAPDWRADIVICDEQIYQASWAQMLAFWGTWQPAFLVLLDTADEAYAASVLAAGVQEYLLTSSLTGTRLRQTVKTLWQHRQLRQALDICEPQGGFSQTAMGISQVDMEGRFIRVNEQFCRLLGYSRSELLQLTDQAVTHPHDWEAQVAREQPLLAANVEDVVCEKRYLAKDGRTVWARVTASLIQDASGTLINRLTLVEAMRHRQQSDPRSREPVIDIRAGQPLAQPFDESRAQFQAVYEQAAVGMALADLDKGTLLMANQWLCDFLGYSESELQQLSYRDYSHPEDQAIDDSLMAQLLAGELSCFSVEKRLMHQSGEEKWANITVSLVSGADGQPLYDLCIVQDIGDRKRLEHCQKEAEQALQEREVQLLEAQRLAHVGNWEFDLNTQDFICSPELLRICGLDDTIPLPTLEAFAASVHPDDWPELAAAIRRTRDDGTPYALTHRIVRPDGAIRQTFCKGQAVCNDQNQVIKLQGVSQDITEITEAELALQASEHKHQTLIRALPDLIMRMSRDGMFLDLFAARNMTVLGAPEAFVGRHVFNSSLPAKVSAQRLEYVDKALSTGELQIYEQTLFNGQRQVVEEVRILPSGADEVLVIVRDITERKAAEEALRLANESLHQQSQRLKQGKDALAQVLIELQAAQEERQVQYQELMHTRAAIEIEKQRYQDLFNFAPDGYVVTDADGVIQEANRAIAALTGTEQVQLVDCRLSTFIEESNRPAFTDLLRALKHVSPEIKLETEDLQLQSKAGYLTPVAITGTAIFAEQQVCIGHRWRIQDISDRKATEAALQTSEERLRTALEAAQMANWDWDLVTNKIVCSEGFERLIGLAPGTFDGGLETFIKVIHPDDRQRVTDNITDSIQQGIPHDVEFRVPQANGRTRWLACKGNAIYDAAGQPLRMAGMELDITDRKEAELSLQRTNALLAAINTAQTQFITDADPQLFFDHVLKTLLALTDSEYGFIGEILLTADAPDSRLETQDPADPKPLSLADIAWFAASRHGEDEATLLNKINVCPLQPLVEQVIAAGQPVIANHLATGEWSTNRPGMPDGCRTFLGVPFHRGDQLVGVVGLVNRLDGYDRSMFAELALFLRTCQSTIEAYRHETQRRQAEQALQQLNEELEQRVQRRTAELARSETDLRTIFNHVHDAIFIHDLNGVILDVNDRAVELLQATREQIVASSITELSAHDADIEQIPELLNRALKGEVLQFEWKTRRYADQVTLETEVSLRSAELGNRSVIIAGVRDIGDRKQAEAALQESRNMLKLVLDAIPQRVFWKDRDSRFLGCNPAFANDFQLTDKDILDKTDAELPWADEAERYRAADAEVMSTGVAWVNYEESLVNGYGELTWIRTSRVPLTNAQGEVVGVLVCYEDITERKRLEQEQARLLKILEVSPDHVGMATPDGQVIWNNRQAKQLRGLPPDTDSTQFPIETYHPQWAIEVVLNQGIPKAIQTGIWMGETALLDANGEEIPVSQTILAHKSETGEIEYLSTTMRDISLLKEAEMALRRSNEELEARVIERTADYLAAKDAAEAANRTKSTFFANMSHELRTPLNAILGFSQLMGRDPALSTKHLEELKIINRSGEHLLNLINDILEMSKIEAGQVILTATNFELPKILNSLADMLRLKAEDKSLQFTISLHPRLPRYIRTDGHKLKQVLLNLLSNAIKFTQTGYVVLRAELGTSVSLADRDLKFIDKTGGPITVLRFQVEDSGVGIAADELDLLFEPFVQTRSGRQSQEGTGLGLPISRQFVDLLGGHFEVTSEPGLGSTFAFEMPVQVMTAAAIEMTEKLPPVIALAPDQPAYRILVVEDSWANRVLLNNLLTDLGFVVQTAVNGQAAIERWQAWQPDLILMDIRMPGMNGHEATQAIRRLERAANPPTHPTKIICLTASILETDQPDLAAIGFDDHVCKPIQEAAITQVIAQHLGTRYLYAAAAVRPEHSAAPQRLTSEALQALPLDWIRRFQTAITHLNQDEMLTLIAELSPEHDEMARLLEVKVQDFDYERLLKLTQVSLGDR